MSLATRFEERRAAIKAFADRIEANKDTLAQLLTKEQGKPLNQSAVEVGMALTVGKIVPAVYTGNTVIVKPFPFTLSCALKLAELAGSASCRHPSIDKISFTGSTLTGKRVMANCANTLKRVTRSWAGTTRPSSVTMSMLMRYSKDWGPLLPLFKQICMIVKRLYIYEEIYDEFWEKLDAIRQGQDLFGSLSKEDLMAALSGTLQSSWVMQEELFALILPMLRWSDEDDVIARANATEMGLGASLWSRNVARARRIAD
ncbi:hypothetical protein CDV55_107256 [Aspergillus turcosus]|nr:hypothetical protein CDV55_107256 [Aspergillus turcosus]